MFTSEDASKTPPYLLREIVPVDRMTTTGGSYVDTAIPLWFGWNDQEDALPDWATFKPFEHPRLLPHVTVCKRIDGRYRCVLVGEAVRHWLPPKFQGQYLDEAMPAVNAEDVTMRCNRAIDDALPNYVEKTMAWNPKHRFKRYRALYLPFAADRDGNHRILTVFDFENGMD